MEKRSIIDAVRSLMPTTTIDMLRRPPVQSEARYVAERQATKLRQLLGITRPSVEVELVLELPEIDVEALPGLPVSGSSEWTGDRWLVRINSDESLWRARTTLAHEIKHILDDPFREQLYPEWSHDSLGPPPAQAEAICDYFAGCLLVPRRWVCQAWDNGIHETADLASLFDVSHRMMAVRMEQTRVRRRGQKPTFGSSARAYHRRASGTSGAVQRLRAALQPVGVLGASH